MKFVLVGVGILGAAFVTRPWTTLLLASVIYLGMVFVGWLRKVRRGKMPG